MLKKLRMYLPFVNAGLQEASTYRANWLFYILGDVIGWFVFLYGRQCLFQTAESLLWNLIREI